MLWNLEPTIKGPWFSYPCLFLCLFPFMLPLLCGLTSSAHKNMIAIHYVPHNTIIAHTPCHFHILEWSVHFQLHFFIKYVLEFLLIIELKCVYKTMCDMWVKSTFGYINKEIVVCVFTKMWGWNLKPPHIQWGHKEIANSQSKIEVGSE